MISHYDEAISSLVLKCGWKGEEGAHVLISDFTLLYTI